MVLVLERDILEGNWTRRIWDQIDTLDGRKMDRMAGWMTRKELGGDSISGLDTRHFAR
jgi:hypothetical protein